MFHRKAPNTIQSSSASNKDCFEKRKGEKRYSRQRKIAKEHERHHMYNGRLDLGRKTDEERMVQESQ